MLRPKAKDKTISQRVSAIISAMTSCCPVIREQPSLWVQQNIDLSLDNLSEADGLVNLELTPYLILPIDVFDTKVGRCTIIAVQQSGKSKAWQWGFLWLADQKPCPVRMVYQSDGVATKTNARSIKPLMEGIPKLKRELARPRSCKKDSYDFADASYAFQGAGTNIISFPVKVIIGDELAFWPMPAEDTAGKKVGKRAMSRVAEMDHRVRSFSDSLRYIVTSPLIPDGYEWKEFLKSTMSHWEMKCGHCDEMIPSHMCNVTRGKDKAGKDTFEYEFTEKYLSWSENDNGEVEEESIRVICPAGHENFCPPGQDKEIGSHR